MARSLRHQLVEQLGKEIEDGELPSGSRLDERGLSQRFGISRTPAREVLLQLSVAGLVKLVPRRGAVVLSNSPEETIAMVEVLVAMEGEAAALAARRMVAAEREKLARDHAEQAKRIAGASAEQYSEINNALHETIYAGCRNGYLTAEIRKLRGRLAPYLRSSFVTRARLHHAHEEQKAVVTAILEGDEQAAERAMRDHLLHGGNLFADMFARPGWQKHGSR